MPSIVACNRHGLGGADDHGRGLGERRSRSPGRDAGAAPPHPGVRGDRPGAGRRGTRARSSALEHRAGRRRGRVDHRVCARADAIGGSHRGHHQFLAKALTHVGGIRSDSRPRHARDPGRAAAHARRDPRTRAGVLSRARRLDAPAVVRGRRPRHERDRRRGAALRDRQRVGAEALRHHATSRSTTSATEPARSVRCSRA